MKCKLMKSFVICCVFFCFTFLCAFQQPSPAAIEPLTDFRQIEGVTPEDIAAVEAALKGRNKLVWAAVLSPEAFLCDDTAKGSIPLLAKHIGDLFDIEIEVEISLFAECREKILNKTADFTIDLTNEGVNSDDFIMTSGASTRTMNIYSLWGQERLAYIESFRPLKYAFVENSNPDLNKDSLMLAENSKIIYVQSSAQAIEALLTGVADAIILDDVSSIRFENYPHIKIESYTKLPFYSTSIATANEDLRPIINIVQKYLDSGDSDYIAELYNIGMAQYKQYHFREGLTEEETLWLNNHQNESIKVALLHGSYSRTFYNYHTGEIEGLARNFLQEVELLSGLTFDYSNDFNDAQILINFTGDTLNSDNYLQAEEPYIKYQYVFLSLSDMADVTFLQIHNSRVGFLKNSEFDKNYHAWFGENTNATAYDSDEAAFIALKSGDIDLLLTSDSAIYYTTHFLEDSNIKINYTLGAYDEKHFYFQKNQPVLQAVISKAQNEIDIESLNIDLSNQMYDYKGQSLMKTIKITVPLIFLTLILAAVAYFLFRKNKRLSNNFLSIFSSLETGLLITDIRTDEILFSNAAMNASYGVECDPLGSPCWQVYHNLTQRCNFCQVSRLIDNPTMPIEWEYHNKGLDRWFRKRDSLIEWTDGKIVHMQEVRDITENVFANNKLHKQLERQRLANDISQSLIGAEEFSAQIGTTLEMIGAFFNADGVLLIEKGVDQGDVKLVSKWRKDECLGDAEIKLSVDLFNSFCKHFMVDEEMFLICNDTSAEAAYLPMYENNITGFVALPIASDEKLWGILIFEYCNSKPCMKNELDLYFAQIFTTAISCAIR